MLTLMIVLIDDDDGVPGGEARGRREGGRAPLVACGGVNNGWRRGVI